MSRRARTGLAALALALVAAAPAGAQTMTEAELLARLDSLRPLLLEAAEAQVEERAADETARRERAASAARVDTLLVGPMRVVTTPDQTATARAIFEEVWTDRFAELGRSPGVEGAWFTFQWTDDPVEIWIESDPRHVTMSTDASRERVAAEVAATIAATIHYDLHAVPSELGRWASGNPFLHREAASLEQVYRRAATTRSFVLRDCMAGDTEACEIALGLRTGVALRPGELPLAEWYRPEERRALVADAMHMRFSVARRDVGTYHDCIERGDTGACDALLSTYRTDWTPFDPAARASLLAFALEVGGNGAWDRALEDPARAPAETLARVSGVPLDELVARWRDRIEVHRPEVYDGLGGQSGRTLVWTLLFVALAMRSTRWRLG